MFNRLEARCIWTVMAYVVLDIVIIVAGARGAFGYGIIDALLQLAIVSLCAAGAMAFVFVAHRSDFHTAVALVLVLVLIVTSYVNYHCANLASAAV